MARRFCDSSGAGYAETQCRTAIWSAPALRATRSARPTSPWPTIPGAAGAWPGAGGGHSGATSRLATSVGSLMAPAPAEAAASTSSTARETEPPWFSPISAMTNTGDAGPMRRPPISRNMCRHHFHESRGARGHVGHHVHDRIGFLVGRRLHARAGHANRPDAERAGALDVVTRIVANADALFGRNSEPPEHFEERAARGFAAFGVLLGIHDVIDERPQAERANLGGLHVREPIRQDRDPPSVGAERLERRDGPVRRPQVREVRAEHLHEPGQRLGGQPVTLAE